MDKKRTLLYLCLSFILLFASYKFGQLSHKSSQTHEQIHGGEAVQPVSRKVIDKTHLSVEYKQSIETISKWNPRVQIFKSLLLPKECEQIIEVGEPELKANSDDPHSFGNALFLRIYEKLPLLRNIEKRIAKWSQLPEENGEHFYLSKQEIENAQRLPMVDYYTNDTTWGASELAEGIGNRIATVIMCLRPPEEGGEIFFRENENKKISFKLEIGDAVLIYNMRPDGSVDPDSAHSFTSIKKGTQYLLTKWIREKDAENHSWRKYLPDEKKIAFEKEDLQFEREHVRVNKEKKT